MAVNFPNSPANGATVSVGNKTLEYNSTTGTWQIQASNIGAFAVSDTAPSSPVNGDLWFNSASLNLYAYYTDGDSSQWLQVGTDAEEAQQLSATSSDTAPTSPNAGDMWFDTSELNLYIYYNDGNTSQWVQMNSENTDGISDVSDLTDTTNLLFDGQYSSLTGAPTSSTAGALGTLTKTFTQNEEAEITLSETISPVPNVSVFKEVPQGGLTSKGNWDVNANATNYDFFDEKPLNYNTTTLTPSATGDGTFDSSNPISRRHIPASTAATTYATYGAGFSGGMFGLGLYDWGGALLSDDGTKFWMVAKNKGTNSDEAHIYAWTLSTPFRVDTAAAVGSTAIKVITEMPNITALLFNNDGTKIVCANGNNFYQFDLSTAYDLSTMGSGTESNWRIDLQRDPQYIDWSGDGDKLIVTEAWTTGGHSTRVRVFDLNTSYDITTMANLPKGTTTIFDATNPYYSIYSSNIYQKGWKISQDGLKFYAIDAVNGKTLTKELPSAWVMKTGTVTTADQGGLGDGNNWTTAAEDDYVLITGNYYNVSWTQNGSAIILFNTAIAPNYLDIIPLPATQVFPSTDVGKKVVGNSGSAIITSTAGAYKSVTAFADTSTISSWQLFGAEGKADGTGIQLSGFSNAYNLNLASYDNKNYATSLTSASGVAFSSDGTKMYLNGFNTAADETTNQHIWQYSLSTAWDVTTASYDNISLNTSAQNTRQRDLRFKPDGTVLYMVGSTPDGVWQYDLSTAWDLSTASYSNKTISVGSQDTNPAALALSPDGTKVYVAGYSSKIIFQYDLSTAWDLSSSTYSGWNYNRATSTDVYSTSAINSMEINSSGTKLYVAVADSPSDVIIEYDLPSNGKISDITYSDSYNQWTTLGGADLKGIAFSSSGDKFYTFGVNDYKVYEFSVGSIAIPYSQYSPALTNSSNGQINSSSWVDIDSMVADETKNDGDVFYAVSTDDRTSWGVIKDGDGVRKIARNNSGTWQYNNDAGTSTTVSTGFDLTNVTYDNKSFYFTLTGIMGGIEFKPDGTKLYVSDASSTTNGIRQYNLSTAWDISTAVHYGTGNPQSIPNHIRISDDGTQVYYLSQSNDYLYSDILSTPWDITTISYNAGTSKAKLLSISISGLTENSPQGFDFADNGSKLYMVGQTNQYIYEWSLSTPWDISTASIGASDWHNISSQEQFPEELVVSADGTKILVSGNGNDKVFEYVMSTAFDITTATYTNRSMGITDSGATGTNPTGLALSADGMKLYYATSQEYVFQYSISGSANAVGYGTSETWVDGTHNNEHATLQEALGAQSFNRMDKAQLQAVTDPNHYVLGDTLDLMIAPYAASGTSPLSDGVTIGYQADALIKQAINGTDYEAEFPTTNKVKIKSLAAQNLKIRII